MGYCAEPVLRGDTTQVVGRITGQRIRISHATTRTTDEALQVTGVGTALSLNPCRRLQCVQCPTPSDLPPNPALISRSGFPFTHEICTRLGLEERIEIIQMLWTVAYADGVLDPEEDMLVRQIAGLIHVPDKERGLGRQRALAKLSKGKH